MNKEKSLYYLIISAAIVLIILFAALLYFLLKKRLKNKNLFIANDAVNAHAESEMGRFDSGSDEVTIALLSQNSFDVNDIVFTNEYYENEIRQTADYQNRIEGNNSNHETVLGLLMTDKIIDDIVKSKNIYQQTIDNNLKDQFQYKKYDNCIYLVYKKDYQRSGDEIVNLYEEVNFENDTIGFNSLERFFDEQIDERQNHIFAFLDGHFASVKYIATTQEFYIWDSSGDTATVKNIIRILKAHDVHDNQIKQIKKEKDYGKQADVNSCGTYSAYNSHQEFFNSIGLNHANYQSKERQEEFLSKLQIASRGMELNRSIRSQFNLTPEIKNELKFDARDNIIDAQKKLIEKGYRYQNTNQRKFYEAYFDYAIEIKYHYCKKILEIMNSGGVELDTRVEIENYIKDYEEIMRKQNKASGQFFVEKVGNNSNDLTTNTFHK